MNKFIKKAARRDIILTPDDFVWEEGMGGWTLDGMVPEEWLHAMTDDEEYPEDREEVLACGE
jgi:hypothetical protein